MAARDATPMQMLDVSVIDDGLYDCTQKREAQITTCTKIDPTPHLGDGWQIGLRDVEEAKLSSHCAKVPVKSGGGASVKELIGQCALEQPSRKERLMRGSPNIEPRITEHDQYLLIRRINDRPFSPIRMRLALL